MISGVNRASERRRQPDEQEDGRHHRQPRRPPLLEQLLAQEGREPGHRSVTSRGRTKPRPSRSAGRRRTDELEEDVLERRAGALERLEDDAAGDDRAAARAFAAASGSETVTRMPGRRSARHRSIHGAARSRSTRAATWASCPGAGTSR